MLKISDLKNKKIAIYGLGREGRAVLHAIRRELPQQTLTLLNDDPLSDTEQETLAEDEYIRVMQGKEATAAATGFDVLIKSPGISLYREDMQAAKQHGVYITSPTRLWFAAHGRKKTVCITGTKGKSTSAALLAHLLRYTGQRVSLGGNIGLPLFDLPQQEPDIYVVELSSYQTSDFDAQPTLSMLLNLFPEHTDWHGSTQRYYRDKLNLLVQTGEHPKLVNAADPLSRQYLPPLPAYIYFNREDSFHLGKDGIYEAKRFIMAFEDCPLPGMHNLSNLCAVFTALKTLGVDVAQCVPGLAAFQALPHRLHVLGERGGLRYVDDSISTTPQSSIAALQAFSGNSITLLAGGYDRGLDWHVMADYLRANPIHGVVTMGGNAVQIAQLLQSVPNLQYVRQTTSLPAALQIAQSITPPSGVIILSPGAPSYGEFTDFRQRGKHFALLAGFGCDEES